MPQKRPVDATPEREGRVAGGWPMLLLNLAVLAGAAVIAKTQAGGSVAPACATVLLAAGLLMLRGFFTLQPNEARVLILFGNYKGTAHTSGFHWANPFYARLRDGGRRTMAAVNTRGRAASRTAPSALPYPRPTTKLSLRARNFNSETLKVNDKRGNPVEIAAVIVWRIEDTAHAVFDVEDYASYVEMQSESAIRSIASRYAYDHGEEHETTLRGGAEEVALALKDELQIRLSKAGVVVDEARLTHLAYAPEIASAMLRRQQAEAVIAARQIIVRNAVGMVHMALTELDEHAVVKLDDERRAAMVSNLLVVLCGGSEPSPVINTGTLYT
jgi:regulator of protease activity HflC (stomatin/prohibitin superfamily)